MRFECKVSLAHVMSVMLHSLPLAMTSCFVLLHFSELIFSIHRSWAYPCPNKHVYRYNRWVLFCVISLKGSFSRTVPLQEILKSIVTENITFWKVTVCTVNLLSKKNENSKNNKARDSCLVTRGPPKWLNGGPLSYAILAEAAVAITALGSQSLLWY